MHGGAGLPRFSVAVRSAKGRPFAKRKATLPPLTPWSAPPTISPCGGALEWVSRLFRWLGRISAGLPRGSGFSWTFQHATVCAHPRTVRRVGRDWSSASPCFHGFDIPSVFRRESFSSPACRRLDEEVHGPARTRG